MKVETPVTSDVEAALDEAAKEYVSLLIGLINALPKQKRPGDITVRQEDEAEELAAGMGPSAQGMSVTGCFHEWCMLYDTETRQWPPAVKLPENCCSRRHLLAQHKAVRSLLATLVRSARLCNSCSHGVPKTWQHTVHQALMTQAMQPTRLL